MRGSTPRACSSTKESILETNSIHPYSNLRMNLMHIKPITPSPLQYIFNDIQKKINHVINNKYKISYLIKITP
jgi:hypothetical protein